MSRELFPAPKAPKAFNQPWVPAAFEIFRKVWSSHTFSREEEKRLKALLNRATSEDVALEAIELMFEEGVAWPSQYGAKLRDAIERVNLQHMLAEPRTDTREELGYGDDYDPAYGYEDPMRWRGPAISFREWFDQQDAEMQARVRRVFPSMKVEL